MSDIHLYSGFVKINPDEPFRFEVEEMEIKKIYQDGTIETRHPYFISSINSTYYFGGRSGETLGKVFKITDHMSVIYSTSKQECMDFVIGKRKEVSEMEENLLKRLNQSKIIDSTKNYCEQENYYEPDNEYFDEYNEKRIPFEFEECHIKCNFDSNNCIHCNEENSKLKILI